jgi:hypothetical protein
MVALVVKAVDKWLRAEYPEVTYARKGVYVPRYGPVDTVEIVYMVHGPGILPYETTLFISRGKAVWR